MRKHSSGIAPLKDNGHSILTQKTKRNTEITSMNPHGRKRTKPESPHRMAHLTRLCQKSRLRFSPVTLHTLDL